MVYVIQRIGDVNEYLDDEFGYGKLDGATVFLTKAKAMVALADLRIEKDNFDYGAHKVVECIPIPAEHVAYMTERMVTCSQYELKATGLPGVDGIAN
jgi:hypothetical protein